MLKNGEVLISTSVKHRYIVFFFTSVLLWIIDMSKKSVFFLGRQISHLLSCINIHIIEIFICMMKNCSFGGRDKSQPTKLISINSKRNYLSLSFPASGQEHLPHPSC